MKLMPGGKLLLSSKWDDSLIIRGPVDEISNQVGGFKL